MVELNPVREPTSIPRDSRAYMIISLSAAMGIFFFIQDWYLGVIISGQTIDIILVGLTLGVPLVLGYTGYSFWEGTIPGILPLLGLRLGNWFHLPFTNVTLRNLVNSFVINTTMSLPVVVIMYSIGVGLRDRDILSERVRPLAIRLAATVLLLIVVLGARHMGYLKVAEMY